MNDRNVFYRKTKCAKDNQEECTIKLENFAESAWWVMFTDTDPTSIDISSLRRSVDLSEICHALGAEQDHKNAAKVGLKPG